MDHSEVLIILFAVIRYTPPCVHLSATIDEIGEQLA